MSPIPEVTLLHRRDAVDSPLSITGNVIGIITLVFAILISLQVHMMSFRSASKDLWAMSDNLRTSQNIAESIMETLRQHCNLIARIEDEDTAEMYNRGTIARENLQTISMEVVEIESLLLDELCFAGVSVRVPVGAAFSNVHQFRAHQNVVKAQFSWLKWWNRMKFRLDERKLKELVILQHRHTEQCRWIVADIETFLSTSAEGTRLLRKLPRRELAPFGAMFLEFDAARTQNEELKHDFRTLLGVLRHHLPREVLSSQDYWASEKDAQSLSGKRRTRRPTM